MRDEPGYNPSATPLVSTSASRGITATTKHELEVEKELELSLEKREPPDTRSTIGDRQKSPA